MGATSRAADVAQLAARLHCAQLSTWAPGALLSVPGGQILWRSLFSFKEEIGSGIA
jgi:hypothetical protein